ncbi:MAG: tetratricopeptide repeat protein [Methanothrix sp.]|nr:tetratricopeptide repeat protein [Methanothrix sp.]
MRLAVFTVLVVINLSAWVTVFGQEKSAEDWQKEFDIFNSNQQYDLALQCIQRSLDLNTNNATAWYSKGLALREMNLTQSALDCYQTALKIDPAYYDVLIDQGMCLEKIGRRDEAIEKYNQAIAILETNQMSVSYINNDSNIARKKFLSTWLKKGMALRSLGRYDEAIICYNKILEINSLDMKYTAEALNNKGMSLLYLNRPEEALDCFDLSLNTPPTQNNPKLNYSVHRNKGLTLIMLKRPKDAIKVLDSSRYNNSEDLWISWFYRGIALKELHRDLEAKESFHKALEEKVGGADASSRILIWRQDSFRELSYFAKKCYSRMKEMIT